MRQVGNLKDAQNLEVKQGTKILGHRAWIRQLWRDGRKQEDKIPQDIKEAGCMGVEWIQLAQIRYQCLVHVNIVMTFRAP
jgi:hypothetical protein